MMDSMANSLTPMIGFLHIRGRRGSCEVHFLRWRRATPVYSLQSALSLTRKQLQVPSHAGDSRKVDAKRDMNLPGACRAAAMPLPLDLAPRGSARPGRRQGHFRYAEGCQGPLPPPHCKLMRDRLEDSIRRPLWRFGVARATAMM